LHFALDSTRVVAVIFSISKKPVLSIKRMEIKKNFTKTGSMIQIAQKAAKI